MHLQTTHRRTSDRARGTRGQRCIIGRRTLVLSPRPIKLKTFCLSQSTVLVHKTKRLLVREKQAPFPGEVRYSQQHLILTNIAALSTTKLPRAAKEARYLCTKPSRNVDDTFTRQPLPLERKRIKTPTFSKSGAALKKSGFQRVMVFCKHLFACFR